MGGLSINEAMCYAKPIVCSVADGTEKEIVREGENGYFFENGNLDGLTEKINIILSDKELCKRMGQKSLSIIENEVNLDVVAERYLEAFEYVLK
jgi:glycosyltransferase involved in cell wall biosynthesis